MFGWGTRLAFALLAVCLQIEGKDWPDLISFSLNDADWTISNTNGSVSFLGHLPLMTLEGLVNAGIASHGDPIKG